MVESSLFRRQCGQWLATHYFGPYLVWRPVGLGPIQSIGWSRHVLAHMFVFIFLFSDRIIHSVLVEQYDLLFRIYYQPLIPYVLEGGGWGSVVLRGDLWPLWDCCFFLSIIWQRLRIILFACVYWYCIPYSAKTNGLPHWFTPFSSWTPWWVVEHRTSE